MVSLVSLVFVIAAIGAITVLLGQLAGLSRKIGRLSAVIAACPEVREVRVTFRTTDIVPLGGTILRGRFNSGQLGTERRRPAPQGALPVAA